MDGKQDINAESEARHDLAASPDRSQRHEEALRQYLRAAFYGDTHRKRQVRRDDDPRRWTSRRRRSTPVSVAADGQRTR